MGKARIAGGGDDGYYTIEVLHSRDRIDAEITRLTQTIAEIDADIAELELQRDSAEAERDQAQIALDNAISEYAANPGSEPPDLNPLIVALAAASEEVQKIEARLRFQQSRRLDLQKRKQLLEAIPEETLRAVWCADLTEDLSGEVATIELPGESSQRIIVRPGYSDAAVYNSERDGQLSWREGMSPEQAYFNAAILPGWQRWMPLHRVGVITSVDEINDTCSLTLQGEDSSAQNLPIDPPDLRFDLTAVPIVYMDCNAVAFETGDRVLVEFQNRDWAQPRVIGFETEPKPCLPRYIEITLSINNVDSYNPMDTWDATETNILDCPDPLRGVQCYYSGGLFYNTRSLSFLFNVSYIDHTVPDGYTVSDKGLWGFWHDFNMIWSKAVPYNETVGGPVFGNKPPAPLEFTMPNDTYLSAAAEESTFDGSQDAIPSFIRKLNGIWLRTMNTRSYYIPQPFPDGFEHPYIDLGYDALYRIDCHASLEPQPGADVDTIYATGSYSLEKLTDDPAVIASSYFDIPSALTVPVVPGSSKTVTYNRSAVGWRVRPGSTDFRVLSVVYALEGAPAPTYEPGFWAT